MRAALLLATVTGAVLLAPAGTATADTSALETIGLLEAQGYNVNIDRVGSAPLEDCVVVSVRNPQSVTQLVEVDHGHGLFGHRNDDDDVDLVPVVVSRSISVSLNCTN